MSTILQTPVPTSESEIVLVAAVLIWLLAVWMITRRFAHKLKFLGEVSQFLLFVAGVLILLFLFY